MRISTEDLRRVPIIGGDLAQIGQVLDITAQPCSPNPYIAVKATFAYLPTLVWSLLKPDPLDMAFDRAGRPHSRRTRRRMNVAGVMQLPAPSQPGLSLQTFRLAQLGQRIGWWFLILDATTDFAINWTSMLYQWSGCRSNLAGWAWTKGGPRYIGGTKSESTASIIGNEYEFGSPGNANTGVVSINQVGPKTFRGEFTINAKPYGEGGKGIIGANVVRNAAYPGRKVIPMSGGPTGYGESTWTVSEQHIFAETPNTSYQMHAVYDRAEMNLLNMSMDMNGAPPGGILHDP